MREPPEHKNKKWREISAAPAIYFAGRTRARALRCLGVLLSCLMASAAQAYVAYQGMVTSVYAVSDKVVVTVTNGFGSAFCTGTARFWLDPSAIHDKNMFSLAIAAKLSGQQVWVAGADACESAWPLENTHRMIAIDLKG